MAQKERKPSGKKDLDKKKTKTPVRKTDHLTKKEIEHFKALLLEKLKELIGDVNSIENGSLKQSRLDASGDLSSMPIHMADIGTDNYEQEFALGLLDSERKILFEIISALKRIDEGDYGICEGTGQPIGKTRLEACPWSRYCIDYAVKLEKGLVTPAEKSENESRAHKDKDSDDFDEELVEDVEQDKDEPDEDMDGTVYGGGLPFNDEEEEDDKQPN